MPNAPDAPATPYPLIAALAAGFADDPDRTAIVVGDRTLTWRDLAATATATAATLGDGARPIGTLGLAGAELLVVLLAASMHGRAVCTLHEDWSDAELAAALDDARVDAVVTRRDAVPGPAAVRPPLAVARATASAPALRPADTDADADPLFYVGFTSGSSGRPKPFARRQRSWSTSFVGAAELFAVTRDTRVVLAGNLQHSHFLFGAALGWSQGAALDVHDRFDAERLVRDLRAAGPTVLYLVPTMLAAVDRVGGAPCDDVRTVVVSGAKLEQHHWDAAARLFPSAEVAELYGASESSFITVNRRGPDPADPGYVGDPFPGVELAIRPREDDEPGHGLVHIRSAYLFAGYLEDGRLTAGVPDDGFVTVGDVGTLRPDGGLSLRGRASSLVITGGKNVHPEEIEIVLVTHDAVAECVVVGVPDPYWGEMLVAHVVPAPGATVDEAELRDLLRDRIAGYKVPKRWTVVDRLPRLAGGKVDRRAVRAEAVAAAT